MTTTAIVEYDPVEAGLEALRSRYGDVAFDLRSTKGNAEARAARKELVSLRTSLEAKRKELKAPLLARASLVDSEAKRITAEVIKLEQPIDEQIKADEVRREAERREREAAEAKRVARIQDSIRSITETALRAVGKSSAAIADEIEALELFDVGDDYDEFKPGAQAAKESTLAQLQTLYGAALATEQEATRLQAEREELARQQAEAKRQAELQAAELAEAQRIEREKLSAERAEMERQQSAERERIAAEQAEAARVLAEQQRIEAAALEAERAEQARKDAEARAAQAEQDRIEREARAAQQAKEDAERAERQRLIDEENARVAAEQAAEAARIAEERAALSKLMQAEEAQRAAVVVHQETPRIVSAFPIVARPLVEHPDDCPTLDEILESIAGDFNVSINTARAWLIELVPQLRVVPETHPVIESLEP